MTQFLAYRFDALFNIFIGTGVWIFLTIFSMYALTARTGGLFGWTREELIVLSCIYNVFIGVFSIFFAKNFSEFSGLINRGRLDTILVKPVDSQFGVSLWNVGVNGLIRFVLGMIIIIIVIASLHVPMTGINILTSVILGGFGILLMYSLLFLLCTTLIWYPRLDNLTDVFYTIRSLGRYPSGMYQQLPELLFLFLSPFIIAMGTPARALFGHASLNEIVALIATSIAAFVVSRVFWRYSLRYYSSASG